MREFNWSASMVGHQGIKGDKGEKGESEVLQAQCHTPTGNNACGKICGKIEVTGKCSDYDGYEQSELYQEPITRSLQLP